ncbi:hypothetical protein PRZ48_001885 [Zasmidium cellare]|uniref:Zn(2)-C6 fungal-type domain-containing protein n=1 Tax=Zasmidium cellare TaxID=395010 RepID=A0ABR0F368_ZASCE|nr:hypothetical protein PRZ48_001885 [Zasmidium cellare]
MADGARSPLPFPSPSAILGDNDPTTPPGASNNARGGAAAVSSASANKKDKHHARRPSKDTAKKIAAPRKAASAVENKDATSTAAAPANASISSGTGSNAAAAKPKQTKSRNGCLTCKAKRLKCGEEKPGCLNCAKRNVTCGGYKKVFQWRDYGQPMIKTNLAGNKQGLPPMLPEATKSTGSIPDAPPPPPSLQVQKQEGSRTASPHKGNSPPQDSAFTTPEEEHPEPAPPPDDRKDSTTDEFASVNFAAQNAFAYRSRSLSPGLLPGHTPTVTECLEADPFKVIDNQQDFVPFSLPEDMHLPLWSAGPHEPDLLQAGILGDDFLVEQLQADHGHMMGIHTPTSFDSGSMDDHAFFNGMGPMPQFFMSPDLAMGSPESLATRFDRMTCGVLSIMDGPTENPWRTLIWPMAQSSPALFHAVLAMTAFHSAHDNPTFRVIGQEHKMLSIRNIQEGIRDNSMNDQTAIATALALGFSESWDQHTATGNTHIKGAQALVKRALDQHRERPLQGADLKRLKFLCNAWVYMDVIARLTSVDSDESNDFDRTFLFEPNASRMVMGHGQSRNRGFGIDFGMEIDARLDPLMGCAGTLFPLIGRVANLVRKVCRSQTNNPWIVSQARDLKIMLDEWDPPEEIECPEDPTTGVQHTLQTGEAYRWATLLHLHQAVPELPSMTSAEFAQKVLACLATVPVMSRTIIVQIYPLMVAGCEAADPDDRQWVRERWHVMMDRMRIGVIEKCLTVTEEVWRRKDVYEAKPVTHRKLVKTADLNPARRRGVPLPRRSTDSPENAEIGRTGIVFSYIDTDSEPMAATLKDVRGPDPDSQRWRRDSSDRVTVDPAYSVRGHLHWVGVMWDWAWEGSVK